jgi:pimeloyl-ACP methyl ester carboxylesterase
MLLDGTVDLTTGGTEYYADQARAYGETLLSSLQACNADPACAAEAGGDAVAVYDDLIGRLDGGDLEFRFPRPTGGYATRRLTLPEVEATAISQSYSEGGRMLFTRAMAAWASRQDLVPVARLMYEALSLDPQTLDAVPTPEFSGGLYYGVDCRDYSYPGDGPEDKAENYIRAGDRVDASVPRLASAFSYELPCAYWPAAVNHLARPEPLTAKGIPTIVMNGTADPATPYHQAVDVYHRLDDGYLITKTGGPHVIFGWGDPCVDGPVTEFLVNGKAPPQRETTCEGVVAEDYVPLPPEQAADFADKLDAMSSIDTELNLLPEYASWDGSEPTEVGCPSGGTLRFAPDGKDGEKQALSFHHCTFTRGFTVTGAGTYDVEADAIRLNLTTDGRWDCRLRYRRTAEQSSVSGPCRTDENG